ncbi:S1 RNA-binding domain-containing protein [Streptomyces sp. NRRL S-495]|uniref:S1 RNA-binding domain-containing protein n=1 Tax=Streptomyces sp. NRRL S-495 TaxID=1609133 RepID=UPI0005F8B0FF|nr:S1 RNA-binding domain-containing protein [Streptomyces sp. NRRL S-495]KJY26498.1 RNA-binding protein S1 [Streptomyces sp. NRRL S-495]
MLPYVYRITKYDPVDRDERGIYTGTEEAVCDHGPVEAAYLRAVAAFAEDTGVRHLSIREPQLASGFAHFGLEPAIEGHGLAGLFPGDLAGFHDGVEVPLPVGLELVRAMLRDSGVWCRLEVEDTFAVHVGWDQYLYVGSSHPCEAAVGRVRALGLFPERLDSSPYDIAHDGTGVQRPADAGFWARLRWSVSAHHAAILEENHVGNASRWHRLTRDNIDAVRSRLAPRALLTVWPDLSTDVDALNGFFPDDDMVEIVWEDQDGRITSAIVDETDFTALAAQVSGARAAAVLSLDLDARRPLFTAVLPDDDGVVRARWRTEPTPSDRNWAFLKTLHRGQIVNGTVTEIASFGVTFVDIGGFTAMINIPELSWRHINHPTDVVAVGQRITAEILDVDMVWERVPLSLRALQENPLPELAQRIGQIVTGPVTRLVPFGAFVRIEDREDGFEGLVHNTELAEPPVDRPEDVVQVGDLLTVKIIDVDLKRHRIALSCTQARAASSEERPHA